MKAATLLRRDSNTGVCEIFKNTFFHRTPTMAVSGLQKDFLTKKIIQNHLCYHLCIASQFHQSYSPQLATFLTLSFITDDLKCLNIVAQQICKDKLKRIF